MDSEMCAWPLPSEHFHHLECMSPRWPGQGGTLGLASFLDPGQWVFLY